MVRILISLLLFVHGLIHLIGFFQGWNLGSSRLLSGKTLIPFNSTAGKISGIVWLIISLTWIVSSVLCLIKKDFHWVPALVALVLSQLMLIVYWNDAKYGTLANVIILLVVIFQAARSGFNHNVEREVSAMYGATIQKGAGEINRDSLPPIIIKWLAASGSTNDIPTKVHVAQTGVMRSKPSANWMNFSANQYYTLDPPAFVWTSAISTSMFTIAGRDKFVSGRGNMLIKPFYVYTLANTSGHEIDEGAMIRYMAELIWFPEAARMNYFHWETIDSNSASISMTLNGISVTGIFTFDETGLVKTFSAQRYGDFDGQFKKETWEVKITEHKEINGHLIGTKGEVTWKLKEGDFTWLKVEVKDISYGYN